MLPVVHGDDLVDANRRGFDLCEREKVRNGIRAASEISTREVEVLSHAPRVVGRPPQIRRESSERVGCA